MFEVLSPANRRLDREVKADKVLAAGVQEVWLVDPDAETVEIRTPSDRRVVRGTAEARSRVIEGFAVVPDVLYGTVR